MSTEIKLVDAPIEAALAELKSSIQLMDTTFSKEIEGENVQDMVNKLNEMKASFEEIVTMYQALLVSNVDGTKDSIEAFKEMESSLANSIQLLK